MSRLNRSALAWGAVFLTIGLAFLLEEFGVWQVRFGVLVPVLLVIAGTILVVSAALPGSRAGER